MRIDGDDRRRAPCSILFLAMGLCACVQLVIVGRSPIISRDGITFIQVAESLRADPLAAMRGADQHPGYPGIILACLEILRYVGFDESFTVQLFAARLTSNLAGVLCVAFIWHLARRIYDDRTAAVAALIAAVLPVLRQNAADALSDAPHLLCFLAAASAAIEGFRRLPIRRSWVWFALAGAASATAYLMRPEGLEAEAVIGGMLAASVFSGKWAASLLTSGTPVGATFLARCRPVVAPLVALSAATSCVAGPYIWTTGKFAHKVTHKYELRAIPERETPPMSAPLPPTAPLSVVVVPEAVDIPGLVVDRPLGTDLTSGASLPSRPWAALYAAIQEFGIELSHAHRYILLFPLAIGVVVARGARRLASGYWLLLGLAACHSVLLIVLFCTAGYISHRHVIPIVAVMLPVAASGLVFLCSLGTIAALDRRIIARRLTCALVAIALFLISKTLRPLNESASAVVAASEWVKSQAAPGDALLSSTQYGPFYTRLPGQVLMPGVPLAAALARPEGNPWPFVLLEIDQRAAGADRRQLPGYLSVASFTDAKFPRLRAEVFRPAAVVAERDGRSVR